MARNRVASFALAASLAGSLATGCTESEGARCDVAGDGSGKRILVAQELTFVVPDDGVTDGFDLDGRVSDDTDALTCNQDDYVDADGNPGIDNQFAALWSLLVTLVGEAVEGLIRGVINDGTLLLMFQFDGIDDVENDDCVNVHIFQGAGHPDLGTDGFIAPSQTFDVKDGTPYTMTSGYIEDGVLVAGPFEIVIPIAIFQVVADLRLHRGMIRATFDEDGSMIATVAGGVERAQIMEIAQMAAENDGTAQGLVPLLPSLLRGNADLGYDEIEEECMELSTVVTFRGTPAYLYEDANDPTR